MKLWTAVGVLGVAVLATACSPTPSTSPSRSSTLGDYPPQDMPLAQASTSDVALARAWHKLGIQNIIPGADIFSKAPDMPVPTNDTGGVLTNAQVGAVELAIWRTETLLQWAQAHDEITFLQANLVGSQGENDIVGTVADSALNSGGSVVDPDCDIFPTLFGEYTHTYAVNSWLGGWAGADRYASSTPDAVVMALNEADCLLTITVHGRGTKEAADLSNTDGVDLVLWLGEVHHDPTIGDFFKGVLRLEIGDG